MHSKREETDVQIQIDHINNLESVMKSDFPKLVQK